MVKTFVFLIFMSFLSCGGIDVIELKKSSQVPKDHNFFRKKYVRTDGYTSAYKFYSNGRVNYFSYKNEDNGKISLDPTIRGYRGVCYLKNNKHLISLVEPISQDQTHGIKNYELIIKGDTLIITNQWKNSRSHIYIKQKLSKENLKFKTDRAESYF